METPTLQALTEHGQKMDLKGTDLQRFIAEQQAHYRDMRAAEREAEREKLAAEREAEREKLAAEREAEREKLKADRDFQIQMEEIKLRQSQMEQKGLADVEADFKGKIVNLEQQLQAAFHSSKSDVHVSAKTPKMPYFDELKDDIDSYLRRFERYATAQKWTAGTWAVNLSALLRGRALDVYSLLPQDQALDYAALKAALLKRFERTEDGFRQQFRKCRPEKGETFAQFTVRLSSYLTRWLEMGGVTKSFAGLYDLMLRDQLLSICNKDLLLFLKERIPNSIERMSVLADQYKEARQANILTLVYCSKKDTSSDSKNGQSKLQNQRDTKDSSPRVKDQQVGSNGKKEVKCFKCHKLGHVATNCPLSKNRNSVGMAVDAENSRDTSENPGKCGSFTSVTTTTSVSQANTSNLVNTSSCNSASLDRMPTSAGRLNGHDVTVLRDTGCNGVVIRRDLVAEEQLTGSKRVCLLADGSKVEAPIARVSIDTPYYIGEVEAWCLNNPLFELIVGNIPNVRDPADPDDDWELDVVQAVTTRQQAQREGRRD